VKRAERIRESEKRERGNPIFLSMGHFLLFFLLTTCKRKEREKSAKEREKVQRSDVQSERKKKNKKSSRSYCSSSSRGSPCPRSRRTSSLCEHYTALPSTLLASRLEPDAAAPSAPLHCHSATTETPLRFGATIVQPPTPPYPPRWTRAVCDPEPTQRYHRDAAAPTRTVAAPRLADPPPPAPDRDHPRSPL